MDDDDDDANGDDVDVVVVVDVDVVGVGVGVGDVDVGVGRDAARGDARRVGVVFYGVGVPAEGGCGGVCAKDGGDACGSAGCSGG